MAEASEARDRHPPCHGFWSEYRHEFVSRLLASTIVASIVVLTPWMWTPFDRVAAVVSVFFESYNLHHEEPLRSALAQTAVVKIDEKYHRSAYDGRSPLNRCVLAGDLQKILSSPRVNEEDEKTGDKGTVAVDLDLSPTGFSGDKECEKKLDALIDRHAEQLILMEPSHDPADEDALDQEIARWRKERIRAGVQFGHVYLADTYGAVRDYDAVIDGTPAFGHLIAQRLDRSLPRAEEDGRRMIAVRSTEALLNRGASLPLKKLCAGGPNPDVPCDSPRTVIFGSGYTADDRHVTAAGVRDGVDLHASIAACPRVSVNHFMHFVFDIAVGALLFAPILHCFWKRYRLTQESQAHRAAYVWLVAMALATPLLVVVVTLGSAIFQAFVLGQPCAVALVPAGVAVGMLIDAAVTKPLEEATHSGPARRLIDRHTFIRGGAFLLLLGFALAEVFHVSLFD